MTNLDTGPAAIRRYQERMHKVLQYIDAHLDQALSLEILAEQAHFSTFHFHRLFAALMGERIGDYVRRRRLEVAALRLLSNPSLSILSIALAVGFTSAEAFSRAFKERFAVSPSLWRQQQQSRRQTEALANSKINQINRKFDHAHAEQQMQNAFIENLQRNAMMKVQIVQRPPVKIAYLRHVGHYGAELGEFWRQQVTPWLIQENLVEQPRYGISHDDPSICEPHNCRYDAAVEVPANYQAQGLALCAEIPAGLYAALDYYGTSEAIGAVWDSFLRDWLPASGYQLDARPCFEYYPAGAGFDPVTRSFECQIILPITPF